MKYMKLYGSMAGDQQHAEVARLLRRIERYRRALRRCARRRKREREAGATLREPAKGHRPPFALKHQKTVAERPCPRESTVA